MVIWTPRARSDLKSIYDYIGQDSPQTAKKIIQEIANKADILAILPNLGKLTPELEDPQVREISAYSWRIIYQRRQDKIFVLTVVHKRKQLGPDDITAS
ncbi:MAG: type II toxin-antitoxin system RelE/ParE family toxin [Methylococcaceae bacterium]|nr:type II toxin-antitoxin system RelE/ParE family toxin [Methylococcaceae bacterium]